MSKILFTYHFKTISIDYKTKFALHDRKIIFFTCQNVIFTCQNPEFYDQISKLYMTNKSSLNYLQIKINFTRQKV